MKRKFNPEQVEERINEVRHALKQATDTYQGNEHAELQVMGHVAELNSALSERAEIASQRLETLTVWLSVLTIVLSVLTATLIVIAYRTDHNISKIWGRIAIQEEHQKTQNQQTNAATPSH